MTLKDSKEKKAVKSNGKREEQTKKLMILKGWKETWLKKREEARKRTKKLTGRFNFQVDLKYWSFTKG